MPASFAFDFASPLPHCSSHYRSPLSAGAAAAPLRSLRSPRRQAIRWRPCASGLSVPPSPPGVRPTWRSTQRIRTSGTSPWRRAACGRPRTRGLTFTPIFDTYGSYSMCCVLVDPKNSNVVWLATGENTNLRSATAGEGVFKSTDAGATWRRVGLERSEKIGRMAIDPRNSDVVWVAAQGPLWSAGGDRGLYKTTDGGQTWKAVLQISENTGVTDVVLDPRNPDVVYAAAYQRRRHLASSSAADPRARIYKSTDGGATLKKLTDGLPDRRPRPHRTRDLAADAGRRLRVDHGAGNRVAASSVRRTRGETWTKQSNWNTNDPQYYGEIFVDPSGSTASARWPSRTSARATAARRSRRSSWPVHVDNHHIGFDPTDSMHLLVRQRRRAVRIVRQRRDLAPLQESSAHAVLRDHARQHAAVLQHLRRHAGQRLDRHAVALRTPERDSRE